MGILTEREKDILRHLQREKSVMDIGKLLEVPVTSVSRFITSIKRKARDIEEDIDFLRGIGCASFDKGEMRLISGDRDSKTLGRLRQLVVDPICSSYGDGSRSVAVVSICRGSWKASTNRFLLAICQAIGVRLGDEAATSYLPAYSETRRITVHAEVEVVPPLSLFPQLIALPNIRQCHNH